MHKHFFRPTCKCKDTYLSYHSFSFQPSMCVRLGTVGLCVIVHTCVSYIRTILKPMSHTVVGCNQWITSSPLAIFIHILTGPLDHHHHHCQYSSIFSQVLWILLLFLKVSFGYLYYCSYDSCTGGDGEAGGGGGGGAIVV